MLSDFEIITHDFPKNEDLTIIPISDVHLGARECFEKEWEAFCKELLERKNTYIVIVGDMINNGIKTSVTNVYEETIRPRDQKIRIAKSLEPIKDRILAIVSGNHERRNKDVDNAPLYDIACKLNVENLFRENIAFVMLRMGNRRGSGEQNPVYTFAVTHGHGSSIYTGAAATKAERFGMAIDGIDFLVVGHIHKPMNYQVGKIRVNRQKRSVKVVPWHLVVSTSWLGYSSYAAQKMLTPTVFAMQEIRLTGGEKRICVTNETS